MTLLLISFFAGVLTVLSPCVLPLLPVIVGGTLAGNASFARAVRVTLSLGISVFLFTLLLKVSTALIRVPQSAWNWISGAILFLVGIFFLFPNLWDLIPGTARANRESNQVMSKGFMKQSIWGDIIVGAALGPVFSTCSPTYFVVLASVLPVSFALGLADIFAYVLGLCLFLFAITLVGQRLIDKLNPTLDGRGWFRRIIGSLFLVIGALIVTNSLARVEAPLYSLFDETKIEQYFLQRHTLPQTTSTTVSQSETTTSSVESDMSPGASKGISKPVYLSPAQKAASYSLAPELVAPDAYLNTDGKPITLAQYRGKAVVLVDFWTYSCINCQRTLPYLKAWYEKYKDQGLVIVGVHTPEFAFEHLQSNVENALKQFGITYPVVLDNEYRTWVAFENQFWPHEYLIDIDGYVVHDKIGEGEYAQTEQAIQQALMERSARLKMDMPVASSTVSVISDAPNDVRSPETYFGSNRNDYLGNGTPQSTGMQSFTIPDAITPNTLYLDGSWDIEPEYARNISTNAQIEYTYSSQNLYFVASGMASGTEIQILQDGVPVTPANAGKDVTDGTVTITGSRLYHLISNPEPGVHTIDLIIKSPGLEAYTFTFG